MLHRGPLALKALGWGVLGGLACFAFQAILTMAVVLAIQVVVSGDALADRAAGLGRYYAPLFSAVLLVLALAVGVAIRKRRKAFVVGWFILVGLRAIQVCYSWLDAA
ncbi:MAG: hypothetical protein O3A53_09165 [Acidobacteria bacterium]|nr:hypothetical protein [Acidobacteriota bacterium]MDA1234958.1 hypothetical protein [Acidobacteriota bacterium]